MSEEMFRDGRPVHFDSNAAVSRIHTIAWPVPRKRCECWKDFGHISDYYSHILLEVFPELGNLSDEQIEAGIRRLRE